MVEIQIIEKAFISPFVSCKIDIYFDICCKVYLITDKHVRTHTHRSSVHPTIYRILRIFLIVARAIETHFHLSHIKSHSASPSSSNTTHQMSTFFPTHTPHISFICPFIHQMKMKYWLPECAVRMQCKSHYLLALVFFE